MDLFFSKVIVIDYIYGNWYEVLKQPKTKKTIRKELKEMSLESKMMAIETAIKKQEENINLYKSLIVDANDNIKEYKKTLRKLEKIKASVDSIFEEAGFEEEDEETCEPCTSDCDCDSGACMTGMPDEYR